MQNLNALIRHLFNTQQKFYINCPMNLDEKFTHDCNRECGFRIKDCEKECEDETLIITMFDGSGCSNGYSYWRIGKSYFVSKQLTIIAKDYVPTTSNKGLKNCFNCGCKTTQRRDFSDMSIREFCPRCKI